MRTQKEGNRRIVSVTVVTERVLLVRRTDNSAETRCERCGARMTIMAVNGTDSLNPGAEFVEAGVAPARHPVGSS